MAAVMPTNLSPTDLEHLVVGPIRSPLGVRDIYNALKVLAKLHGDRWVDWEQSREVATSDDAVVVRVCVLLQAIIVALGIEPRDDMTSVVVSISGCHNFLCATSNWEFFIVQKSNNAFHQPDYN